MDNAPAGFGSGMAPSTVTHSQLPPPSAAAVAAATAAATQSAALMSAQAQNSGQGLPATQPFTVPVAVPGTLLPPSTMVPGMPMAVPTVGVPHPYPPTATQIPNLTLQQRIEQAQLSAALAHSQARAQQDIMAQQTAAEDASAQRTAAAASRAPDVEQTAFITANDELRLLRFWEGQLKEHLQMPLCSLSKFKTHSDLPLARIKRIMKADEDVRMVSAEAPVIFARACRVFILELTMRSWFEAEEAKRKTLQKEDVHAAILKTDVFDFLVDVVDGTIEEEQKQIRAAAQKAKAQAEKKGKGSSHGKPGKNVRVASL